MCRESKWESRHANWRCNTVDCPPPNRESRENRNVYGSDYILTRPEEFADGVKACFDDERDYQMPAWPELVGSG